jgi:chitinase
MMPRRRGATEPDCDPTPRTSVAREMRSEAHAKHGLACRVGTLLTALRALCAAGAILSAAYCSPAIASDRPRIGAYLTAWSVGDGLGIDEVPAELLTHVFYAFGGVSEDLVAVLGDPCRDLGDCPADGTPVTTAGNFAEMLALKRRHPHLKVLISLGGWAGSKYFSDAAATAESRKRFAGSAIDMFILRFPGLFDGIDVDWEFPVEGGMPENTRRPEDGENFELLIEELRRHLDALPGGQRYELTIAVSALAPRLRLDRLAATVDWINAMTYDYHAGSSIAHFNSPLFRTADDPTPTFNVDESVQALLAAGVPAEKVVMGVPFYGRGYRGVPADNNGLFQKADPTAPEDWPSSDIAYRELMRQSPEAHGFQRFWHDEAQVPWLYNPDLQLWITYDDPRSIEMKAAYARQRGLGGVMFWELSGDDGSLLAAIHKGLRP